MLLKKGIYLYQFMDNLENFDENTLQEKEEIFTNLNMEHITKPDYYHIKQICKDFEIKKLGEYHD